MHNWAIHGWLSLLYLIYQLSRCVARQLHASRKRQQRVRHTPKARRCLSTKLDLIICHFMSCSPYIPNLGSLSYPHGLEEAPVVHRPGPSQLPNLIILNSKSYNPYILNLGSLYHSYGLEEVPLVHRPGPDHLPHVSQPHHWSFSAHWTHHAKFGVSLSSPRPRRGTCGPLT